MFKAVLFVVAIASLTQALPTGAPSSACSSMSPSHGGSSAQSGPSPYEIGVQNIGDKVIVEITSPTNAPFRGLFLQVRTSVGGEAVGHWTSLSPEFNLVDCHNTLGSALTHASNSDKFFPYFFEWNPPTLSGSTYQVYASIVQEYSTYWVKIPSATFAI